MPRPELSSGQSQCLQFDKHCQRRRHRCCRLLLGKREGATLLLKKANSQSIFVFNVLFLAVSSVAFARFRNAKTCCACICYYYLSFFARRQFLCFPVSAVVVVVVERKMKAKSRFSFNRASARVRVTICTEHCSLSAHTFCPGQANKIQHQRERGQRERERHRVSESQRVWARCAPSGDSSPCNKITLSSSQ